MARFRIPVRTELMAWKRHVREGAVRTGIEEQLLTKKSGSQACLGILFRKWKVWSRFVYIFFYLFFKERDTESMRGRGAERGRQRIPSNLCAISTEPDAGLRLTNCEIVT